VPMMRMKRRLGWMVVMLCVGFYNAGGQCTSRTQVERVDKRTYEQLQHFVNEGHEPWRLDSQAVAATQILALEKVPKGQWDPYLLPLTVVQESQTQCVYRYENPSRPGLSYQITVKRFDWLLPFAEKWEWMVWAPLEVTVTDCPQR
jgi:hypothetical protein